MTDDGRLRQHQVITEEIAKIEACAGLRNAALCMDCSPRSLCHDSAMGDRLPRLTCCQSPGVDLRPVVNSPVFKEGGYKQIL